MPEDERGEFDFVKALKSILFTILPHLNKKWDTLCDLFPNASRERVPEVGGAGVLDTEGESTVIDVHPVEV